MVELFREYLSLYELRNKSRGQLPAPLDTEWKEVSFTVDCILAGPDFEGRWSPELERSDLAQQGPARKTESPEASGALSPSSLGAAPSPSGRGGGIPATSQEMTPQRHDHKAAASSPSGDGGGAPSAKEMTPHELKKNPTTSLRSSLPLLSLRVPIEKAALVSDGESIFPGVLCNLSRGGAYLQCSVALERGTQIRLGFRPGEDDVSLSLTARVVWKNPGRALKRSLPEGVGIEFLNNPEASRRRIRDHIYEVVEQRLSGRLLT